MLFLSQQVHLQVQEPKFTSPKALYRQGFRAKQHSSLVPVLRFLPEISKE